MHNSHWKQVIKLHRKHVRQIYLGTKYPIHTMPFNLTDTGVSIIKELLKDGRKSFRKISHSMGISTPTVKARFDRLVNVGFIKSISPVFD